MLIKVWFWHMWPPPWWSIHHADQTCKGLLNLVIKIWNSICSICYNCIFHFSHISGQFDLSRIGSVIYHPDPIIEKSLNIQLEFWNSASDICYSHICAIATFFEIWSPPIKVIYALSSSDFWGDSEFEVRNLKIQPVASTFSIFQLDIHSDMRI